jgi:hypothetical protein
MSALRATVIPDIQRFDTVFTEMGLLCARLLDHAWEVRRGRRH